MSISYEVSVVLPFGDDEDAIGPAVQKLAAELRAMGMSFEILAVDEDSGDNSHAVLALQRARVPELRVIHAPRRGRGDLYRSVARCASATRRCNFDPGMRHARPGRGFQSRSWGTRDTTAWVRGEGYVLAAAVQGMPSCD